jgi:phenylacetate-CoA ligase
VWRAGRSSRSEIITRQEARSANLITFARARSPLYRELYSHLPDDTRELARLPVVTKPALMARFDEWVTDRDVTISAATAHMLDRSIVGQPFAGKYLLLASSGITGLPGISLHDAHARMVYRALVAQRGYLSWMTARQHWAMVRARGRVAALVLTGGHYVGASWAEQARTGRRARRLGILTLPARCRRSRRR